MAKVECMYFTSRNQGSCDILSSTTDSLDIFDESPPSYIFQASNVINEYNDCKVTLSDNSDSGFGTGSDDDSLTTNEQPNSPEVSENLDSKNFFDFWNRSDLTQANKGCIKSKEINCLNLENSVSNSLNESLSNNEEPEMTLTDLLSAIDVENSSTLYNSKCSSTFDHVSSATYEKSTNFDEDLNTCDLFKYIHTQEESDGKHKLTSHDSPINENLKDNTYFTNVSLSDLLTSINFDDSNESVKHHNLLSSEFNIEEKSVKNVNTTTTEFNLDYSKDPSTLLSFTNKNDSYLSDMLSSISFEEINCNENYKDTDSYVENDVVKQIDKHKLPNLLHLSENETEEVSLAILAKNHLAAKLASPEEVSLTSLAEKHLASIQDSSSSNCITSNIKNMSPCSFECHDLESVIELTENFKSSAELKPTQNECENIDNDSSMLDLLSSLTIKEIYTEDKYINNKNSSTYQYDGTASVNSELMTVDLMEVDLTTCLNSNPKTSKLPYSNVGIIRKDEVDNCTEVLNLSSLHYPPVLSHSPNQNLVSTGTKAIKCKTRQSLFAKTLSSKPKKNFAMMCKVLNLKKNLCNHFFQPLTTVPSEKLTRKAKIAFTNLTSSYATTSCGIRTFSP